jgi:hypothetical protein
VGLSVGGPVTSPDWQPLSGVGSRRGRPYRLVSWLALVGLVIPAWEGQISVAGAKLTAGRLGVTLLVFQQLSC